MNIENYLNETLKEHKLHFTLIDPDEQTPQEAVEIAKQAKKARSDAILVGGSITDQEDLNITVKSIKEEVDLPVILFPGNISGVSKYADALLFMSLLNSTNPYWITGAQALSAPSIKKMGIETIPMGYLIIEPGGTVGWVGDSKPIPRKKSDLAVAYALAAEFLGMRVIYLEAGSGADSHIPVDFIMKVKKLTNLMVIVGGGIKTAQDALEVKEAGADIIITGTVVEETDDTYKKIKELTDVIH
ncbi:MULTISPECIES: phosphoglycerol geranylgeranyltransferase [Methanosphaera]|jgi:phosphoglycerol geranylgeranyltransferase|uniref:Geranylgeranylglyceryl phosphate synthase n=2 Tax=Methanosphaera stadtmanae TaxID=2317 RepID=GGGPS_METST|nr:MULTISPECIES: geranylgeranylglyceryl/heptaprenylglyceryl phosphate synthase [Methanosphaera]Q2NET5.1 RecName: Full=Geranylgeranylglyceryl phosphate synthase; Short=GGGP synthase; Short=GGGPS; AltName: Full=(S)-3-O-geranylgeranylglyceryl phosphate synthase; AltName: Full=Phosphoglycerol geranylgeranyltransferase [Methanosphaera stadtmanae DSM 3091]ABC57668.1 PcrB [Methanosphaera stadtmanae DSM 3091]MDO5821484.1 geranylgeranylglyceryl/heptaprenylglyceryl phosphate synthase [Methanosphaera sp.]